MNKIKAQIDEHMAEARADFAELSAKFKPVSLGEKAKTITLGMAVVCTDGKAGSLERVVGDPETHEPAYVVVRLKPVPARDVVVPVSLVADVTAEALQLNAATGAMQAFPDYETTVKKYQPLTAEEKAEVLPALVLDPDLDLGMVTVRERTVPEHMVDLKKGMIVYDRTGLKLGEIEGAVADAEKKQVTHVVMRAPIPIIEGRRLVPVNLIDFIIRSDVYLRVSINDVADLPLYTPGQ